MHRGSTVCAIVYIRACASCLALFSTPRGLFFGIALVCEALVGYTVAFAGL